jgi:hypothetical protein
MVLVEIVQIISPCLPVMSIMTDVQEAAQISHIACNFPATITVAAGQGPDCGGLGSDTAAAPATDEVCVAPEAGGGLRGDRPGATACVGVLLWAAMGEPAEGVYE